MQEKQSLSHWANSPSGEGRDGVVRGEMEAQVSQTRDLGGGGRERADLLRAPKGLQEAGVHKQQDRVLQQADKADGEEADAIRDRGGVGEADRLGVPALQRRPGKRKVRCWRGIVAYCESK